MEAHGFHPVPSLSFRKEGTGWNQLVNVESETAPLAISRAWLIWDEERKEK